jgi:hypothetical protein
MELARSGLVGMRAPPGASDGVCLASARLDKALRHLNWSWERPYGVLQQMLIGADVLPGTVAGKFIF